MRPYEGQAFRGRGRSSMRPYTDGPDGADKVTQFSIHMLYEGLKR